MKEIKRTRTIEEVTGYEAEDGTFFRSEDECKKYEESAEFAIRRAVKEFRMGTLNEVDLFMYGQCDCEAEIFDIRDAAVMELVNRYLRLVGCKDGSNDLYLKSEYIGKEIIITWDYDHYYYGLHTLDKYFENVKKYYANATEKYRKAKANESTQPV